MLEAFVRYLCKLHHVSVNKLADLKPLQPFHVRFVLHFPLVLQLSDFLERSNPLSACVSECTAALKQHPSSMAAKWKRRFPAYDAASGLSAISQSGMLGHRGGSE